MRLLLGTAALLAGAVAVAACTAENPPAPMHPVAVGEGLDCAALLAPATRELGWSQDAQGAQGAEHAGRCQAVVDGAGEVTVGTRAVPASSAERAEAAQEELERQCDRIRRDGRQFVGEPDWLAEGTSGCLTQVDDATGTGVAELLVLNRRGEVVQIRIAAFHRLAERRVEAAMRDLAAQTLELCEASCA